MPSGRKPKPTHLKLVTGNAGKRPVNKREPKMATGLVMPPPHLSKEALEEWERIAPSLVAIGILTVADRAALAAYCQSYARWKEAEEELAKSGLLTTTTNGNIIQNPLVGIANKAAADMVRYAAEFGMTPSARSKLTVPETKGDGDEQRYLA